MTAFALMYVCLVVCPGRDQFSIIECNERTGTRLRSHALEPVVGSEDLMLACSQVIKGTLILTFLFNRVR